MALDRSCVGLVTAPARSSYTWKDVALYALGVGAGKNPTDSNDLRVVFERNGDGSFKRPEDYPPQALVSSTTHDLPTLAGFWAGHDIDARRALGEARRQGIGCLCLTVGADTEHEDLQRVFGSAAHSAIAKPAELAGVVGPLFKAALRSADTRRKVS